LSRTRARRLLLVALGVVAALSVAAVVFAWAASDRVLGWAGYSAANERLVTGILVTGTAESPVLYVSSSDPRFGRGLSGREHSVDTNSGVISRLVRSDSAWQRVDLVRGLPRSNADHATNGMALSSDRTVLYVAQGSNTNEGAPAAFFGNVPEYALSGAILSVDLRRLGGRAYDLPTLDDPSRSGVHDENDPFGGNKGLNQARLVPGGPVQVFASGLRNPYDVVVTAEGRVYTIQNGPNAGYGGQPVGEGPEGRCTNAPRKGGQRGLDTLHLLHQHGYYGHPNPTRGNPQAAVPSEELPVPEAHPIECEYVPPSERNAMARFAASTNGLAEYTASNLAGSLEGDLIAVALSGEVYDLRLSDDGRRVLRRDVLARLAAPLDVTTQGSDAIFPGTIWVAQYAGGTPTNDSIAVLEPRDDTQEGWLTLPSTGLPRQEVSFVQAGGKFYLAGGDTRHQVYDPRTRRWSDIAPLPAKLDHIQGVALGRRIFYIGGLRHFPRPDVNTVYVYDTATDRFSRGASMPRGRGAGGVVAYQGKIYYAGGLHDGRAVPWLDVYDPATDSWSELKDLPRARDHFQAVVVSGKLYAIGGRDSRQGREIAETDAYDIASGVWRSDLSPLPTLRGGYAAAAVGRRIYVIGGETESAALNVAEAYDIRRDTWRTVDSMPTARHGVQAAVCNGGIFIAAGGLVAGGESPTDVFEAYFPEGRSDCGGEQPRGTAANLALTFLHGAQLTKPTSLQFGPDGRLYVAQQNGLIKAFTIERRGAGDYTVTDTETIRLIQSIPNHDDDGSSATDFSTLLHKTWERIEDLP
jgi:glucose/arabinose dehydrogenase/N-acetylneuraminic acid mutarotase